MLVYHCTECRERIRPGNFVTGSGRDEAMICDCCEEYACHIRCFTPYQRDFFDDESDDVWLCDLCIAAIEENSDSCCICPECEAEMEAFWREMDHRIDQTEAELDRFVQQRITQLQNQTNTQLGAANRSRFIAPGPSQLVQIGNARPIQNSSAPNRQPIRSQPAVPERQE